jgi:hypothetical protein
MKFQPGKRKKPNRLKNAIGISLLVGAISMTVLTPWINNTIHKGAVSGGDDISKKTNLEARFNPEKSNRDSIPYSLLFASIPTVLLIGISFLLTMNLSKK